jgi:AcrR family transcriptional regulator
MAHGLSTTARPRRQGVVQAPSLRELHADETRQLLLQAALALMESGEEPTMRAVAHHARVGERTIYRYFPAHQDLIEAVTPLLAGRAGVALCSTYAQLPEYARALFEVFDANRALNTALLSSGWAAPFLKTSRRKNLEALAALVDAAFPRAPRADRAAAAAMLRTVLSGSGWFYQCVSCGIPVADAIAHVHWLIATVTRQLSGQSHKR